MKEMAVYEDDVGAYCNDYDDAAPLLSEPALICHSKQKKMEELGSASGSRNKTTTATTKMKK